MQENIHVHISACFLLALTDRGAKYFIQPVLKLLPGIWNCCGQTCNHNHPQCPFFHLIDDNSQPQIADLGCKEIEHTKDFHPPEEPLLDKYAGYSARVSRGSIHVYDYNMYNLPAPHNLGLDLPDDISFVPVRYPSGKPYVGPSGIILDCLSKVL
jgi:hypothetical protein